MGAQALIHNANLTQKFLHKTQNDDQQFWLECTASMIMWPQSNYVSKESHVACLPSVLKDTQRILHDAGLSCDLNEAHVSDWNHLCHNCGFDDIRSPLTLLVKKLYSADFELWDYHCRWRS